MKIGVIAFTAWGLCAVPAAVLAGAIRLNLEPAIELTHAPPSLVVTVRNDGDEPARGVAIEASVAGWSGRSTNEVRSLRPDESCRYELPLTRLPLAPGIYAVVVKAKYGDLNGSRASAITLIDLTVGGASRDTWALPLLTPVTLADSTRVTLRLASIEDGKVETRVRLVLPDELACRNPERVVTLEPGIEREEVFEVSNVAGRPGSAYAVAAVLEADFGGWHRSAVADGMVQIEAVPDRPLWKYGLWFGLSIGLIAFFIAMERRAVRKH